MTILEFIAESGTGGKAVARAAERNYSPSLIGGVDQRGTSLRADFGDRSASKPEISALKNTTRSVDDCPAKSFRSLRLGH